MYDEKFAELEAKQAKWEAQRTKLAELEALMNLQETELAAITKLSTECHLGAALEHHSVTSVAVELHQNATIAAPTCTAASPQASNRPETEPASRCPGAEPASTIAPEVASGSDAAMVAPQVAAVSADIQCSTVPSMVSSSMVRIGLRRSTLGMGVLDGVI